MSVLDVLAEVFTWAGFLGAAAFGLLSVVLLLADGTWLPARGYVEHGDDGPLVRWIDADGAVHESGLTHDEERDVGDREAIDLFSRRGGQGRMRLTRTSPAVRATGLLALGLVGLGVLASIGSIVLLFAQG